LTTSDRAMSMELPPAARYLPAAASAAAAARMLHGASFACLVNAVAALLVVLIPTERGAQVVSGFSPTPPAPTGQCSPKTARTSALARSKSAWKSLSCIKKAAITVPATWPPATSLG